MNIIDKVVHFFNPSAGVKRQQARQIAKIMNAGYSHGGASKRKKSMLGWISSGGSPTEDIDENLEILRERSRDLYMNTPIATGALKTIRTNVVGAGLRLKSQIDYTVLNMDEEQAGVWEAQVEREFKLWSESVFADAMRMNNFYELQQIAFLSFLMSGETFATLPYRESPGTPYQLTVNLLEADRVTSPGGRDTETILSGVELGQYGDVTHYHVCNVHPLTSSSKQKEWYRIPKFGEESGRQNILHLMIAERPEQRRGVPLLSPAIEAIKQLGRYTEAELMAALVSSMYTVFIKSDSPDEAPFGESISESDQVDAEDENSYELGAGAIISLGEGEEIEQANPMRNNATFDGFVRSVCRQIGSSLELPYELLLKHFTSSYSASRAALLEAWKMFRMRREWLAARFCQPIYEEWLAEAIALGRIDAPGYFDDPLIRKAYCGAEWNGPSQGQIDPLKEVNAAIKRVDEGFSTRAKETAELTGGDFWRNLPQRIREERAMKEGGLKDAEEVLEDDEQSEEQPAGEADS